MLFAYPTQLPLEAFQVVVSEVTSKGSQPVSHAVHAAWEIVGYGVNITLPDNQVAAFNAVKSHLASLGLDLNKAFPKALNWQQLIVIVLQLLGGFLNPPAAK